MGQLVPPMMIRWVLAGHVAVLSLIGLIGGCAADKGPVLAGFYQTWDDVITRWIRQEKRISITNWVLPNFIKKQKMAWKNWYGI